MKDLIDRQNLKAQIEMAENGMRFDTQRVINGEPRQYARFDPTLLISMIDDMPSIDAMEIHKNGKIAGIMKLANALKTTHMTIEEALKKCIQEVTDDKDSN